MLPLGHLHIAWPHTPVGTMHTYRRRPSHLQDGSSFFKHAETAQSCAGPPDDCAIMGQPDECAMLPSSSPAEADSNADARKVGTRNMHRNVPCDARTRTCAHAEGGGREGSHRDCAAGGSRVAGCRSSRSCVCLFFPMSRRMPMANAEDPCRLDGI